MNNKKLLYTLLLGATLTSCAEVEICERDKHPHEGDVNFTYTWNKPEDKPKRMGVLCYRVVGQWKQVAEVNTDDLTLRLIGKTTITPENRPNENPDEGDSTGGDNTGGDNTDLPSRPSRPSRLNRLNRPSRPSQQNRLSQPSRLSLVLERLPQKKRFRLHRL